MSTKIRIWFNILIMEKDEIVIQAIIDAAKKLIQQFGVNKTTMEDIARVAGKGKSTLYYYFKSKDEILEAVIKQEIDDFYGKVKSAVDIEDDAKRKLKTYIIAKIRTLNEKKILYRNVIDFQPQIITINDLFSRLREKYDMAELELISSIFKLGIKDKLFNIPDEETVFMLSELLVTCVRGIEMDIVNKNKFSSLESKADLLVGIIIKGLT